MAATGSGGEQRSVHCAESRAMTTDEHVPRGGGVELDGGVQCANRTPRRPPSRGCFCDDHSITRQPRPESGTLAPRGTCVGDPHGQGGILPQCCALTGDRARGDPRRWCDYRINIPHARFSNSTMPPRAPPRGYRAELQGAHRTSNDLHREQATDLC